MESLVFTLTTFVAQRPTRWFRKSLRLTSAPGTRPLLGTEVAPILWSRSVTPIPRACVITTKAAAGAIATLQLTFFANSVNDVARDSIMLTPYTQVMLCTS